MAELNKRQYKDLDKKITGIQDWMKEEQASLSDRNLLTNFSFMMNALENYQKAMDSGKQQMKQLQQGIADNYQLVEEFVDKTEAKEEWDKFLEEKRVEAQKKFDEDNDPNFKEAQKLKEQLKEAEDDNDTE